MKKILFAVAAIAFTFASCGNKTQAPVEAAVDSTEVAVEEANAAADEAISALSEQIEWSYTGFEVGKRDLITLDVLAEDLHETAAEHRKMTCGHPFLCPKALADIVQGAADGL